MPTARMPLLVLMAALLASVIAAVTSSVPPTRAGAADRNVGTIWPVPAAPVLAGPIGSPFVIEGAASFLPSVAFNTQEQEYLVVWSRLQGAYADIYGQRVSKNGKLVGSGFAISAGTGVRRWAPKIAYNRTANEYLVVWQDEASLTYTIRGRRVSANGQLLGTEIQFITIIYPNAEYEYPAVAYASASDLYMVVWSEYSIGGPFNIVGRTLSGAGALDSGPLTIHEQTPVTGPGFEPRMTYNRERNEFLVISRQDNAAKAINGQRVKLAGGIGLLGSPVQIIPSVTNSYSYAVASLPYPPGVGQYLVVGEQNLPK